MKLKEMMRVIARIFGAIYLIIGGILISNAIAPTGLAIVESLPDKAISLTGVYLIANGIALLSLSRKKKGQASMEFLMDYGWMILAVIGALVIIGSYTLFASNKVSESPPILSAPMHAIGQSFDPATGEYNLEISTSIRGGAQISSVTIPGCTTTAIPITVLQGGTGLISADCPNGPPSGQISIVWNNGKGGPDQVSTGIVSGSGSSSQTQQGQGGNDDLTPAYIIVDPAYGVNGDLEEPYSSGINWIKLYIITNEPVLGVRAALDVDEGYDEMEDGDNTETTCTYDAAFDHWLCEFYSIADNPAQMIYVAAEDLQGNKNSVDDNLEVSLEIYSAAPIQSDHSPSDGQEISAPEATISFTINEPGTCKYDFVDNEYAVSRYDCTNANQLSKECTLSGLESGLVDVYIKCEDIFSNKNSVPGPVLTYTAKKSK